MKPQHDSELMAFADGELDETSSRALEDRLGRDPASRSKVDAVSEVGEIVRGHLELSADAVPQKRFDALWREIDKGIDRERAASPEAAGVPAKAEPGVWSRMGRWFDRYRGHVLTGAVSAGAVAALALLLRNPGATNGELTNSGSAREPGSGGQVMVKSPTEPAQPAQPTQIDELDTPDGTGTVFNLEDEDGNTTVIWVTPEDTVEGI
jgi:anti-sigma factor RsiW